MLADWCCWCFFISFCYASNIHISINSNSNSVMILHFSFLAFSYFLLFFSFIPLVVVGFFSYTISSLNKISILFSFFNFGIFFLFFFFSFYLAACCWFGKHVIFHVHRFHSLTLVGGYVVYNLCFILIYLLLAFLPSEFKNELSAERQC